MYDMQFDFLIVGSGAGGATLARELCRKGKKVIVVERGQRENKIGTFRDALRFFDTTKFKTPQHSKEGVILWRTIMAGGSTVVSCGNSTRCLEEELAGFGINLSDEFAEAENDMNVSPLNEDLLSKGSRKIMDSARELGYEMDLMPKFINPIKCQKCGQCVTGCLKEAKWTALEYLDEASQKGADILYNTKVEEVLIKNGKATGVRVVGSQGVKDILANVVILAAGGLGTPVILQNSGFKDVGDNLFVDLFVNTYGVSEELNQIHEPPMTIVNHEFKRNKKFILSSYVNHYRMLRFMENGLKGVRQSTRKMLGIMTKTADDPTGMVLNEGKVSKPLSEADRKRLQEGFSIAKEILLKVGVKSNSVVVSKPQGAHPGGTAAIGKVVDINLQTKVKGLFVCDASVLPVAPGMPPILTICALAKRLAKTLTG